MKAKVSLPFLEKMIFLEWKNRSCEFQFVLHSEFSLILSWQLKLANSFPSVFYLVPFSTTSQAATVSR